jgi:hypothetical protein
MTSLEVCRQDWLELASKREGHGPFRYVLREEARERRTSLCGRLGVRVPRVSGQEAVYLRVWGGGVERLRLEAEEDARSDVVPLPPTTSRFYYFVQLESEDFRPLSLALALGPAAGAGGAAGATGAAPGTGCPEGPNLVKLAVDRPTDPGAGTAEPGSPDAPTLEAAGADRPDAGAPTR